jgi:feruloyl esterase
MRHVVALLVVPLLAALVATPAAASTCTQLATLVLPEATVTAAQDITTGTFAGETGLPAFCRVTATLTPTPQSSIGIEVWMPASGWNGRFEGVGGGGYQGLIRYDEMAPALQQGYAVVNTDEGTGISGCSPLYCGGDGNQGDVFAIAYGEGAAPTTGLLGQPERIKDFGYRAIHLMTVYGKVIVTAYYKREASHAYFSGCSTGGQNALMEAQRYPDDYDGIVAGAPANDRTSLHSVAIWGWQAAYAQPDSFVQPAQLTLVNTAVLAQCAGKDGGVATDPFLTDPRKCTAEPSALLCTGSNVPPACLNADQVTVIQKGYAGPSNPRTGAQIFPGYARGSETGVYTSLGFVLNEALPEPAFDGLFYWVFGPSFGSASGATNFHNFNFDSDLAKVNEELAGNLNATSTDLRRFREHGGKLIMFHGWADPLIPSQGTIDYFDAVSRNDEGWDRDGDRDHGRNRDYLRLFMAPGTWHCGSGPGPNVFGGAFNQGGPNDPDHNILSALVRWVEQDSAPERIIATKYLNDVPADGIVMQRPLCAFPKTAQYKGSGDPNQADSFACVDHHRGGWE